MRPAPSRGGAPRVGMESRRAPATDGIPDEVFPNPDAAGRFLKENNPAKRVALARQARLRMGDQASKAVDRVDSGDEI